MNESNRRIASLNRIDELNQQVASQNDPRSFQESPRPPQDGSKAPQDPPKRAQEPPRAAQDHPKTAQEPPRSPLGTVLGQPWDQQIARLNTRSKTTFFLSNFLRFRGRFGGPKWVPKRPQIDPKTSQKSRRKMHHFFIALEPVLGRS